MAVRERKRKKKGMSKNKIIKTNSTISVIINNELTSLLKNEN